MSLIETLSQVNNEYVAAQARGNGLTTARERMKNVLFNHFDEILKALIENKNLAEENEALDRALQEADDELQEIKKAKKAKGSDGVG